MLTFKRFHVQHLVLLFCLFSVVGVYLMVSDRCGYSYVPHSTLLEFPREVNMVFSWFGSFSFTSIFYFTKMTLIWSHLWPYTDSTWLTWRFGHQTGQEPQKEALQMHYPAQHHLALAPHHLAPPQMQHRELQAYHWGAQRCHCPPSSPSIQGHGTVVYCVTDIIFKHLSNCLCSIDLEL